MEQIMLPIDPEYKSQVFTIDIQPNGRQITLRIELDYRKYVGKYFMTVSNASTGEDILRNFPVVSSVEDALNDLLKQVWYKLAGALVCYPVLKDLTYPDPNGTISEFELLWGDSPWKS